MSKGNPSPKLENLKPFKSEGEHSSLSKSPVSVRLPKDLDEFVRSLPNRNQWIIDAVLEKAAKEIA